MEANPNYSKATETSLDRIRACYDPEVGAEAELRLSAEERQRKEEMEAAHSLLINYHSLEDAVKVLQPRYRLSRATAYRRCTETMRIFGDVTKTYKDAVRHILYEYSMKVFQLAVSAKNDLGQPRPDLKAMNTAIKNMAMLKGLDKEDSSALTPEVLGSKHYYLTVNIGGPSNAQETIDLGDLDKIEPGTYAKIVEAVEQSDLSLEGMEKLLGEAQEPDEEEEDDESPIG